MDLLDNVVGLFLIFQGISVLFSMVAAPVHIPNSAQGVPFSTSSPALLIFFSLILATPTGVRLLLGSSAAVLAGSLPGSSATVGPAWSPGARHCFQYSLLRRAALGPGAAPGAAAGSSGSGIGPFCDFSSF